MSMHLTAFAWSVAIYECQKIKYVNLLRAAQLASTSSHNTLMALPKTESFFFSQRAVGRYIAPYSTFNVKMDLMSSFRRVHQCIRIACVPGIYCSLVDDVVDHVLCIVAINGLFSKY